jgi:ribosomal protein S16
MATRIRLRRMGSNKRPFYRVVVADQRSPRDGRFIEIIGKYHPLNDPSVIEIDADRALHWLMVGAQPSNQVRNLMSKVGIWDRFVAERPNAAAPTTSKPERPVRTKMSKKAQAKAAEAAEQRTEAPPRARSRRQHRSPSRPTPTRSGCACASTGSEPDETPASDAAPTDVQETPEG